MKLQARGETQRTTQNTDVRTGLLLSRLSEHLFSIVWILNRIANALEQPNDFRRFAFKLLSIGDAACPHALSETRRCADPRFRCGKG